MDARPQGNEFEMELNAIRNENCIDTMDMMSDGFVDLVVTSPPYDEMREYEGYKLEGFERIAAALHRVVKAGGVVVWVIGDQTVNGSESGTSFRQALYFKAIGFNLFDTMIYLKPPRGRSAITKRTGSHLSICSCLARDSLKQSI